MGIQWIVASNRVFLKPLEQSRRIEDFRTPFQYLMISAAPERESEFQKLKKVHGSVFAFHGSPAENWHSIMRNGLKNASNTKFMMHGAAHGAGIYLATSSSTSLSYAAGTHRFHRNAQGPSQDMELPQKLTRAQTGNRLTESGTRLVMLALCEVINHPTLQKSKGSYDGGIWVAPREDTVITRFFLVYGHEAGEDYGHQQYPSVNITEDLTQSIRRLMSDLHVGLAFDEDAKGQ